jgi:probable H4MPT-linked C1 transfer pathway protein
MTAELSQTFRTKREGVQFVLQAFREAFREATTFVCTVDADFVSLGEACARPMLVAAANWVAAAQMVAGRHPNALLIDVGTTTTDIIPISQGRVVAVGRSDFERLASGELVYTGALRTPADAISQRISLRGAQVALSAEGFALVGDVHLWRGDLAEADYTVRAPDGRPVSREFVRERLLRLVCADREMLTDADVDEIADGVAAAQVDLIAASIRRVLIRVPLTSALVTGRGAFIAAAAARTCGLTVELLQDELGIAGARSAPAVAVAVLCEQWLTPSFDSAQSVLSDRRGTNRESPIANPESRPPNPESRISSPATASSVELVIKIGGGSLSTPVHLEAFLKALDSTPSRRALIVPGGGPFADAVRDVDRRIGLNADAAHWMAIQAMDQVAELLVSRLSRAVLVHRQDELAAVLAAGRIPVLAPYRWLREVDPLPHSWDVTSDSIAAWIAGQLAAADLLLVKPAGASGPDLVDAYFNRALQSGIRVTTVPIDRAVNSLDNLLRS